jgi:phosphoglycolate phosphatase
MKKLILFDLDGTLLDTAPDFVLCVNQLRERHGKSPMLENAIRAEVSNGARALTQLSFGLADNDERLEPLRQELLALYLDILGSQTTLFPGMADSLHWIEKSGMDWGIVTNKPSLYTLLLMERLKLPFTPATVICPDHVKHSKPHPEPLWLACSQLGLPVAQAVYFGDHRRDIEAGRAAGMPTISCGWGYASSEEECLSWCADHHLTSANEIPALLQTL